MFIKTITIIIIILELQFNLKALEFKHKIASIDFLIYDGVNKRECLPFYCLKLGEIKFRHCHVIVLGLPKI